MNAPATFPAGPCETRGCNTLCPSGVYYCPACEAEQREADLATLRHDAIDAAKRIAKLREALAEAERELAEIDARRDAMHAEALGAREAA